jgi:dTMP kinase
MTKGYFVMVEGLDGSGKGIAVSGLRDYFIAQGKKVFDLREHWKENLNIPEINDIMEYDVICSCEPTYSYVGKAIRDELIRNNVRKYSGMTTAHAFSLDREILYKKLILPAIKEGKIVIQERGVPTSLVYQPIQNEAINLKDIINLPGNKLAIKSAPDLLIIVKIEPIETMNRIKNRNKNDNAIFENLVFQQKAQVRFESDWLHNLFTSFGSKIVYLDTNPPVSVDDTKKKAVQIYLENSQKNI